MNARVSHAEVKQTTQKVLEGLGLPHGLDMDAAANVTWLESRGLGGISALVREIEGMDAGAPWEPPDINDDGGVAIFHAGPARALLLAPGIMDWVVSGVSVRVMDCHAPLLIVAEAARRSVHGGGYHVAWSSEKGRSTAKCGNGEAALSLDLRTARVPSEVTVTIGKPPAEKDQRRLAGFHAQSLRDGILVDSDDWAVMKSAARRVLVPASERSRGGAGAEVDDSA